jgi:hypothetical protein
VLSINLINLLQTTPTKLRTLRLDATLASK